jgi:hypothetical protein
VSATAPGLGAGDPFDRKTARERARDRASGLASVSPDSDLQDHDGDNQRSTEESPGSGDATGGANQSPPVPPPRRRNLARVQLNTRVSANLHSRLQDHLAATDAAVQDVVEMALNEYLDRRGHAAGR